MVFKRKKNLSGHYDKPDDYKPNDNDSCYFAPPEKKYRASYHNGVVTYSPAGYTSDTSFGKRWDISEERKRDEELKTDLERRYEGLKVGKITCPKCGGSGKSEVYPICPTCEGEGTIGYREEYKRSDRAPVQDAPWQPPQKTPWQPPYNKVPKETKRTLRFWFSD